MIWAAVVAGLGVLATDVDAYGQEPVEPAHFHHVHLNVTHPEKTLEFYSKMLNAITITYRDNVDALFTERSFIFFTKVDERPPSALKSSLWHIGWGGVDGPNEYEWLKSQGVTFSVPLTPLGNSHYMYLEGPDEEAVEIYTGPRHRRFNHVHLLADDVNASTQWFTDRLGLEGRARNRPRPDDPDRTWSNGVTCDNVGIIIFGRGLPGHTPSWWPPDLAPDEAYAPTQGRAIDHIAFSYRDIDSAFERMKKAGVTIVEPPGVRPEGFRSFFVTGPEKLLVEIVEEKPIPEGIWEE